jgi:hypothetical protein
MGVPKRGVVQAPARGPSQWGGLAGNPPHTPAHSQFRTCAGRRRKDTAAVAATRRSGRIAAFQDVAQSWGGGGRIVAWKPWI